MLAQDVDAMLSPFGRSFFCCGHFLIFVLVFVLVVALTIGLTFVGDKLNAKEL